MASPSREPDGDGPVAGDGAPLGADMPVGVSFVGTRVDGPPGWRPGDAPTVADLNACVACGLCLPHCPTYRLTGEEPASPRGRINAMKAVADGIAPVDASFAAFMDRCLVCRACEDVCPSHVPFGRLMEAARAQVEPTRSATARLARWVAFHWVLPHPSLVRLAALAAPLVRPAMPERLRRLVPRRGHAFARLPAVTEPARDVAARGTVALLSGCAQDRWFHGVNRATIRVLARNGWRVVVPRGQACCGALAAHNGRLAVARRLARRARHAFAGAETIVVNAAGCGAHMRTYEELDEGPPLPVRDLMAFLHEEGLAVEPGPLPVSVAYHDACHALRAQGIRDEPRAVLRRVPGLELLEVPDGDRCCGAAGTYNVTQPELADRLMAAKAEAVASTGATVVASANPGCSMQLAAGLRALGRDVEVAHPVELLDRAYQRLSAAPAAAAPVHSVPDP
jgi:glycolate oxidase iron-sulfur subunit